MKITRYPEEFGQHRYRLTVEFTDQGREFNRGNLVVVLFNPATIREEDDLLAKSRTRRRLIKLAKDGKYRTMTEVELFAYRSPNKKDLAREVQERGVDPVGPENDQVISEAVQEADKLIVAWGKVPNHPIFARRPDEVTALLQKSGKPLYCIGKNKDGSPTHPARVTYVLQAWP